MHIRHTFRVYPTPDQELELGRLFGCTRYAYNRALRLRIDEYQQNGASLNYYDTSKRLTQWKKEEDTTWLNEVSSVALQESLRRLDKSYQQFFRKRSGYPRFKTKRSRQSASFTRRGFRWDLQEQALSLAKVGRVRIRKSKKITSKPVSISITKDSAGRYFVVILLDEDMAPLPKTGASVGIDLGINHLATLSTGEFVPNPRFLQRDLSKIRRARRILSRRQLGSGRYERQKTKVARLYAHITDSRRDYLHKLTTTLVRKFDIIAIEDLHIRGMMANHPLARSIGDLGLYEFRKMLTYKCLWYGKDLRVIDRFFPSSKTCSSCGYRVKIMPLKVREWECPACNTRHNRDYNAAKNILAAGHAVTGRGGNVRLKVASIATSNSLRSVNQATPSLMSETTE